jgi:flagellar basal body rod protein FlgG
MIDFSAPMSGLDRATSSVNQTAASIAKSGFTASGDSVDLSTEMVSLMQGRQDFEANTKVINTEDEMTKSLLNVIG